MKTDAAVSRAVFALALTTLFWGLSFPLVRASNLLIERHFVRLHAESATPPPAKLDTDFASAAASITLRFALALVLLAICFPGHFRQMKGPYWVMGGVVGAVFATGLLLQVFALNDIPASRSGFLTSLAVVFTPLLMILFGGQKPALRVFLSVGCALLGVAILTQMCIVGGPFGLTLADDALDKIGLGDWLTVLAAAVFAGQIILVDVFSRRMPPVLLTPGMFVATLVISFVCFTVHHRLRTPAVPLSAWAALLENPGFDVLTAIVSVVCTVSAFYLMNRFQGRVTPTQAALIYTLEPVFAAILAISLQEMLSRLLGIHYPPEKASWALMAGGGLVLAANLMGFGAGHPPDHAAG